MFPLINLPARLAGNRKGGSCEAGKYTDLLEKLLVNPEKPDVTCEACAGLLAATSFDGRTALSFMLDGGNGTSAEADPLPLQAGDREDQDMQETEGKLKRQKKEDDEEEEWTAEQLARFVSPYLEAGFASALLCGLCFEHSSEPKEIIYIDKNR